jgi:protein regulator of cytokinesis 1
MVHDLCNVLGMDFFRTITQVHSSLDDSIGNEHKNISNETLSKLDRTIGTLNEDKRLRLEKVTHIFFLSVLYLATKSHSYPGSHV